MPEQRINDRFLLLGDGPREGGMSVVHRAIDLQSPTGETVAVKLLDEGRGRLSTDFLQREQESLKRLGKAGHPNIVRMLDAGWSQELRQSYLVLEWVEHNLRDELERGEPMSWGRFYTEVGAPLVSALACAHLQEIEHRDVKPGNVLVTHDGVVKLADFGIAKIRDNLSAGETVAGYRSSLYSPPERQNTIPFVRDVFSWGVLAVQALSGSAAKDYPDLLPILGSLDLEEGVQDILRACVDLQPGERPANACVLEQQLTRVERQLDDSVERRSSHLWLKLTKAAAEGILGLQKGEMDGAGPDEWQRAQSILLEDFSGPVHADFGTDRGTGAVDDSVVQLAGRSLLAKIVHDGAAPELDRVVVVHVQHVAPERQARWCEFRVDIGSSLTFTFAEPSAKAARNGFDGMLERLYRQVDERAQAEQERLSAAPADPFEGWGRLLEARDDLAAGGRKSLTYTWASPSGDGRMWRIHLSQTATAEIGEEWSVAEHERGRPVERGDVVAVDREEDIVTLRCRHGAKLPARGVLLPYLGPTRVSLNRQRDALAALVSGEGIANPDLPSIVLEPDRSGAGTPAEITTWVRQDLDDSKRDVVRHALGTQPLLVVEGPPGTGKTTVIAEVVEQNLRRDPAMKVLIVSQTHIAIDNALSRLEKAGVTGIVRLGRPDDSGVAAGARHLLLDLQLKKWVQQARDRAQQYLEEMARRHSQEARHLRAALHLEELASVAADLAHVEAHLAKLEQGDSDRATSEQARGDAIVSARQRRDALLERRAEVFADVQREVNGDLTLSEERTSLEARDTVAALLGDSREARALMKVIAVQGDWLQRMGSDREIVAEYLRTRNVVGGTAIGFLGHPAARALEFDLCIFDEASKATATEALVPLVRSKRWILVGDTEQLPPLDEDLLRDRAIMQEHRLTPELVTTTLFDHMVRQTTFPVRHMLTEQYRMTPAIGNLISNCFYRRQLKSPGTHQLDGYAAFGKPVLWIDTGSLGAGRREASRAGGETSVVNRAEAQQVVQRLRSIDSAVGHHIIEPPKGDRLEVLAIAPYSRQVDELRRQLAAVQLPHLDVEVLSVDAVQGRECDLAVVSVTRSNDQGRFGFIGAPYRRRINVALSRARFGLTIIGDAAFCKSKPGPLREVLDYMKAHRDDCEVRDAHR